MWFLPVAERREQARGSRLFVAEGKKNNLQQAKPEALRFGLRAPKQEREAIESSHSQKIVRSCAQTTLVQSLSWVSVLCRYG